MTSILQDLVSQGGVNDFANSISSGYQAYGQGLQNQQAEQQISQNEIANHTRSVQILNALAKKVAAVPDMNQRAQLLNGYSGVLGSIGVKPEEIAQLKFDDQSLAGYIAQTDSILSSLQPKNNQFQSDKQMLAKDTKDNYYYTSLQSESGTGKSRSVITPVGDAPEKPIGKLTFVQSSTGQTAEERIPQVGAEKAAGEAGTLSTKIKLEPTLTGLNEQAKQDVLANTQPNIEKNIALSKDAAKNIVTAKQLLPSIEMSADLLKQNLSELKNHPGRDSATGAYAAVPFAVPGTDQYGFIKRLEQIKGQTFLNAFERMKGSGSITEKEGEKASASIERLSRGMKKEEFDAAIKDLEDIVDKGVAKARRDASGETYSDGKQSSGQQETAAQRLKRLLNAQ